VVNRDVLSEPGYEPWREAARQHGFLSSIALPILPDENQCIGALNIYAEDPDAFDAEEVELLIELSSDLAYGIRALRERRARQAAEAALQESAERLHHLLEASPTITYSLRFADGALIPGEVSDNIERITGHTPAAALQPGWWQSHVHPEDLTAAMAAGNRLLEQGQLVHEYRFSRSDGHYIWINDELRLINDASGQPLEVVGAWTDITARKQAELALRESEAQIRMLLESTAEAIYGVDLEGVCTFVNPACLRMLGYDREEELLGRQSGAGGVPCPARRARRDGGEPADPGRTFDYEGAFELLQSVLVKDPADS
jgi:PAS domain S-box-containing protein